VKKEENGKDSKDTSHSPKKKKFRQKKGTVAVFVASGLFSLSYNVYLHVFMSVGKISWEAHQKRNMPAPMPHIHSTFTISFTSYYYFQRK